MTEEMVDIVDEQDKVIGRTTRREAHAKGLLHRVVHVVVENGAGKILCLKRGQNVDTRPGFISNCAEHVKAGQGYEATAKRATKEELGVAANPKFLGTIPVYDGAHNTIIGCYKANHEGPFKIDETELEKAEFRGLEEIKDGIGRGEKYSPTFIKVIGKIYW